MLVNLQYYQLDTILSEQIKIEEIKVEEIGVQEKKDLVDNEDLLFVDYIALF